MATRAEFEFGTNIEQIRKRITSELSTLERALSQQVKGPAISTDGLTKFTREINRAVAEVTGKLGGLGSQLGAGIGAGTATGGGRAFGRQIDRQVKQVETELVKNLRDIGAKAGIPGSVIDSVVREGQQKVRQGAQELYSQIQRSLTQAAGKPDLNRDRGGKRERIDFTRPERQIGGGFDISRFQRPTAGPDPRGNGRSLASLYAEENRLLEKQKRLREEVMATRPRTEAREAALARFAINRGDLARLRLESERAGFGTSPSLATASIRREAQQQRQQQVAQATAQAREELRLGQQFIRAEQTKTRNDQRTGEAIGKERDRRVAQAQAEASRINRFLTSNPDLSSGIRQRAISGDFVGVRRDLIAEQQANRRLIDTDPNFRRVGGPGGSQFVNTQNGQVFKETTFGARLETNALKVERALNKLANEVERDAARIANSQRRNDPFASFLGGLTSRGIGAGPIQSPREAAAGLAASAGQTVKFTALYSAQQAVIQGFRDTIKEAIDYEDSLRELEVAVGDNVTANSVYADTLERIGQVSGANPGQALDLANRGIRAFSSPGAEDAEEVGRRFAQQGTRLSLITNRDAEKTGKDIVAIASAFEEAKTSATALEDVIAGSLFFGGTADDISEGLASGASALTAAGFSLQEAGATIAVVTAQTSQGGDLVATRLSRITSIIQGGAARNLFQELGIDANGSARDQLAELAQLRSSGQLSSQQEKRVQNTLGGTANIRELNSVLDALGEGGKLAEGFAEGFDFAGKGAELFDKKAESLAGQLKNIAGLISNVQVELAQSGIFVFLVAGLKAAEPFLQTVDDLLKAFNKIPAPIRNTVFALAELALALKLIAAIQARLAVGAGVTALAAGLRGFAGAAGAGAAARTATAASAGLGAAGAAATSAQTAALTRQASALTAVQIAQQRGIPLSQAVILAENAETVAVERQTLALYRNAQAQAAAAGAGRLGAAAAGGQAVLGAAGSRIGGIFAGAGGKIFLGITAVVVADQIARAIVDAGNRLADSAVQAGDARNSLGSNTDPEAVKDLIPQLETAAKERDKASSGIFGNIGDFFGKTADKLIPGEQGFGRDAERDAKQLRAAKRIEEARAKRDLEAREEALNSLTATSFGDVTDVDGVKSSLEGLDQAGASVTTRMRLLAEALGAVGDAGGPGTILPGRADVLANSLAGSFRESAIAAQAESIARNKFGVSQEEIDALVAEDKARAADPKIKESDAVKKTREALDRARGVADTDANNLNPLLADPKKLAELREKVDNTVNEFLTAAGVSEGGQLSPEQVTELAGKLAELYVNPNSSKKTIEDVRKTLEAFIRGDINALTDPAALIKPGDNTTSAQLQGILTQNAEGVAAEDLLRTRDKVGAARTRLAEIAKAEALAARTGTEVSEQTQLARLQAEADLAKALQDRATSFLELAKEQLGKDDAIGRAQADVGIAAKRLADAVATGTIEDQNAARVAKIQADRALEKQRLDRDNADVLASAAAGNRVEQAGAQVAVAANNLNATDKFGENGEITKAYLDNLKAYEDSVLSSIQAQVESINAFNKAKVAVGDRIGEANAEYNALLLRAANEADPGTRAELNRQAAVQRQNSIDLQVGIISAENRNRIDPRNQLANLEQDARDIEFERINTPKLDRGKQAELARRARENAIAQEDERRAIRAANRSLSAARVGTGVARAAADVQTAREAMEAARFDQEDFARAQEAYLLAQRAYADAVTDSLNVDTLLGVTPGNSLEAARAQAQIAARNVARATDPDARKQAELEKAAADFALKQAEAANRAARRASQVFPGSEVQAAQAAVANAADQLALYEKDSTEYYQALAEYNAAQRSLADTLGDAASVARLLQVDITNPVLRAAETLRAAQEKAARDAAAGAPADVQNANALAVRTEQNNLEAAQFQQNLSQIQTNERLGRITHDAYINYLNNEKARLEAIAERTFQQQQQLDEIDGLLQDAASQLSGQFNLGDIALPTVYEVRRSVQQASPNANGASGMTDNSSQTVIVNGADFAQVVEYITAVLGQPAQVSRTQTGRKA